MKILWQKRDLVQNQDIGTPENLPADLRGLDAASLADLSWSSVEAYAGIGFVPVEVFDVPALISAKLDLLGQEYKRIFDGGYPLVIEGQNEALEMRPEDLINWLVFKDSCDDFAAAGLGDQILPLRIRCKSTNSYSVTANQGRQIIQGMTAYGAQLLSILWAKKDAINAATTPAELDAVSVTDGWA